MRKLHWAICALAFFAAPLHSEEKSSEPKPEPKKEEPRPLPPTVAKDAKLEEVYQENGTFFEGPTWDPKTKKLYFTAFVKKESRILRLDEPGKASVWYDKSEGVNGTFLSKDGRMLGAQDEGHRVLDMGIGAEGPKDTKVLYESKDLWQPNDICQTPNGNIYFTDPDFKNKKGSAVYLLKPDGKVTKILSEMTLPNGIINSLDGKTLYIGDSFMKLWRAYPIKDDGTVEQGKIFFNPDCQSKADPDGMSIDENGNLYFTGRGGVWCVSPEGKELGFIPVPEFCSNCSFGGEDWKTLYMTCSKKVYALKMNVAGGVYGRDK